MNLKKLCGIFCLLTLNFYASAIQKNNLNDVPADLIIYVLDFLWPQPNPNIPTSYYCAGHAITPFAQTSKFCRKLSLQYTENRVINRLIKFCDITNSVRLDSQSEADFVAACCAFKIILKIKKTVPNFCNRQLTSLKQYLGDKAHISSYLLYQYPFKDLVKKFMGSIKQLTNYDCNYPTHFHNIHSAGNNSAFLAILNNQDINFSNENTLGSTALHLAVIREDIHAIKILLAAGTDINAKINLPGDDCHNFTALNLAITQCNPEIVEILCLAGANVNKHIKNNPKLKGISPLMQVALMSGLDNYNPDNLCKIASSLINANAHINQKNKTGTLFYKRTALEIAASFDTNASAAIYELLIKESKNTTQTKCQIRLTQ